MSDVEKNIGTHKPEFDGEWVKLGDITKIITGKLDANAANANGRYPFFTCAEKALRIDTAAYDCECVLVAGNGDLNVKYYNGPFNAYQRTYIIESNSAADVCVPYLYHFLSYHVATLRAQSIGGVIKYIKLGNLKDARLPLPPLEKQKAVSSIFELIDKSKHECDKQLSNLNDLVKSQFVEMFGDTYSNSKQLPSRKLGALIDFITSGSRGWSKYYSDEGDYFITIKNVRGCSISLDNVQHVHAPNNKEAERTKVQSGDVLISITADLGRTGVVSKEIADHGAYINQHLACIRLAGEDILPLYLSFFLESPGAKDQLQRKNQTGVKAGLNFDLVKSLDILVPPLALQQQFADFVARVDKLGFDVQQQIEKLETLKQSLMQEYFG